MNSPPTPPFQNPLYNLRGLGLPQAQQHRRLPQPRRLNFEPVQVEEITSTVPEEEERQEEVEDIASDEDLFDSDEEENLPATTVRSSFLRVAPSMIDAETNILELRMWLRWYEPDDQPHWWMEHAICEYLAPRIRSRLISLGADPDAPIAPNAPLPQQ